MLWVTDGSASFDLAVAAHNLLGMGGAVQEFIVVAVGSPRDIPLAEWMSRRAYDFGPVTDPFYEGLGGDFLRAVMTLPEVPPRPAGQGLRG